MVAFVWRQVNPQFSGVPRSKVKPTESSDEFKGDDVGEIFVVDGIFCPTEEVHPEINISEMHNVMINLMNFDIFIHPDYSFIQRLII
jgi:hypothetical protein